MSQACAEYVVEIARTGTTYHAMQQFMADAERNLSFAYVVFFLHLFAFKYLEYKNAVRRNASRHLDMLWRENLSSTRTAKANKVNYRQMSVILVYWGAALVLPLQEFYHNTRTIRWIHAHVGWDMPIEKLNMWIKESIVTNISEFQIIKFIQRLNFMQHVMRTMKSIIYWRRTRDTATPKDVRAEVSTVGARACRRAHMRAGRVWLCWCLRTCACRRAHMRTSRVLCLRAPPRLSARGLASR